MHKYIININCPRHDVDWDDIVEVHDGDDEHLKQWFYGACLCHCPKLSPNIKWGEDGSLSLESEDGETTVSLIRIEG